MDDGDRPVHFKFTAAQDRFFSSTMTFCGFTGGRGAGKSHVGSLKLISRALEAPPGSTYMVIAPTYRVLQDASLKTFMEHLDRYQIEHQFNGNTFSCLFPEGKTVKFRTAEQPGRLRGPSYSGIWMDEAGEIKKDVFDIVIGCLRESNPRAQIPPWLSATFTPKGRQHWTYDTFGKERNPDTLLVTSPTRENIFLPPNYERLMRSQYTSKRAQQELEGQFIDMSAGVFERQWFEIVRAAPADCRWVRYWDKAATEGAGCNSAGVLMGKSKDGLFYVMEVRKGQLSALNRNKLIEQTAKDDAARFGKVEICVEQEPGSGGKESADFTIRQLAGYSVYAERPSGDKVERAQPLAAQAEAGNVKIVEGNWNQDYLDELCSFPEGKADQVDASSAAFNRLNTAKKKFWMAV